MNLTFEIANMNDVEGIVQLCNRCFFENTDIGEAKKIFEKTMNDPNQIYVIGKLDGKVIAHTKITIIPTMFDGMDTYAILNHVCVDEEYRRHKIATYLLDEVTKICKEKTVLQLNYGLEIKEKPAHACYKKYGFEIFESAFFQKR